MNVDTTKKFNHISLCTGYGGIDLGLARVIKGLRAIAYCEIELYAIENLIDKMEKGIIAPAPIWSNLKTFPFKEFHGCVDILSGGFPCQPFSSAGRRNGDTDPRHLFPFIKQGIIDSRPAFVLLENVRGIISSKLQSDEWIDPKDTPVLLHVIRELERIGYECHWGIFSARETGLPHLRQRVFILGKRTDITNSRLKEFSEYFHDSCKDIICTFNGDRASLCESTNHNDQGANGASDPTVLLQKITESTFSIERIESSRICTPSGRDREQQFFEPPRTLRKDLGNAVHKRSTDDTNTVTNYRSPSESMGYGGSQTEKTRHVDPPSHDERMEYFGTDQDMDNPHKERFNRCVHDNTDQGTCTRRSDEFEDVTTSSLRGDERTDQDLGNPTETGFQRCNEDAGNGREVDESREGTRLNSTASTEIRHQQINDELGDAYGKPSHTIKLPITNEHTSESNGQQQTIRFRDASTYQDNDRESNGCRRYTSTEIKQAHIHGTTDDERTSTSQAGIRENAGRNQPLDLSGNVESEMGGNANGLANWLDYEELCNSYTSIVDEIALLGNGVVPATAEIAFRILFNKFL